MIKAKNKDLIKLHQIYHSTKQYCKPYSKSVAFLVASVLAAGFLTGCGGSNAESDSVSQQQESASVGEKETGDEDYSQDVITYGMTQAWDTINASSSGVGGVSKVVMRGTKSIMQSSNALYVVDGVPMFAGSSKGGGKEFDSQGATEPIADINPDDIESMSVLTGAAAAALYGSEAANGAIIITTKKGKVGMLYPSTSQQE